VTVNAGAKKSRLLLKPLIDLMVAAGLDRQHLRKQLRSAKAHFLFQCKNINQRAEQLSRRRIPDSDNLGSGWGTRVIQPELRPFFNSCNLPLLGLLFLYLSSRHSHSIFLHIHSYSTPLVRANLLISRRNGAGPTFNNSQLKGFCSLNALHIHSHSMPLVRASGASGQSLW
jgi:hypothetical protein